MKTGEIKTFIQSREGFRTNQFTAAPAKQGLPRVGIRKPALLERALQLWDEPLHAVMGRSENPRARGRRRRQAPRRLGDESSSESSSSESEGGSGGSGGDPARRMDFG